MSPNLRRWLAWEVHGRKIPYRRKARRGPPRDSRYRAWIRSLPCLVCHSARSHAAHTGPHAIEQKASDYTCIPLCLLHHTGGNLALDRIGRVRFERAFGLRIHPMVLELNRIWRDKS